MRYKFMMKQMQFEFQYMAPDERILVVFNILKTKKRLRSSYVADAIENLENCCIEEVRLKELTFNIRLAILIGKKYRLETKKAFDDLLENADIEEIKKSSVYALDKATRTYINFDDEIEREKAMYEDFRGRRMYERAIYLYDAVNTYIVMGHDPQGMIMFANGLLYNLIKAYRETGDRATTDMIWIIMSSATETQRLISDNPVISKDRDKFDTLGIFKDETEMEEYLK